MKSYALNKTSGFTLLELIVVIIIISIMFGAATLAFRDNSHEKLLQQNQQLVLLLQLAHEKALFENLDIGIQFWQQGYGFVLRNQDGRFTSLSGSDNSLRQRQLKDDIELRLYVDDKELLIPAQWPEKPEPQAFLFSSGEATPFSITLEFDERLKQTFSIDLLGKTTIDEIEEL